MKVSFPCKKFIYPPLHIYRKIKCNRWTNFTQKIPKNFTKKIRARSHNLENAPFFCVICKRLYHSIKSTDCIASWKTCNLVAAVFPSALQSLISFVLIVPVFKNEEIALFWPYIKRKSESIMFIHYTFAFLLFYFNPIHILILYLRNFI